MLSAVKERILLNKCEQHLSISTDTVDFNIILQINLYKNINGILFLSRFAF